MRFSRLIHHQSDDLIATSTSPFNSKQQQQQSRGLNPNYPPPPSCTKTTTTTQKGKSVKCWEQLYPFNRYLVLKNSQQLGLTPTHSELAIDANLNELKLAEHLFISTLFDDLGAVVSENIGKRQSSEIF